MDLDELIEALQKLQRENWNGNTPVIIRNGPWWTKVQDVTLHPDENLVTLDIEAKP